MRIAGRTPVWGARGWRLAAALLGASLVPGQAAADFRAAQEAEGKGDWGRVFRVCRAAADAGERNCQYYLGHLYANGLGVPRNPSLAQTYLRRCAAQGQLDCEEALGLPDRGGTDRPGGPAGADAASKWSLRRSPPSDPTPRLELVGELYRDGMGALRGAVQTLGAFRKTVEEGFRTPPDAVSCNLAGVSVSSRGVTVDWNEVASSAELGVASAWQDCGRLLAAALAQGTRAILPDRERALELAQRAYENGAPAAANALGVFFRDGIGTPVDLARAVRYFAEARDKGEANAWVHLGRLHLEGRGVARDPGKAHGYFLAAQANLHKLSAANRSFIENYFSKANAAARRVAEASFARQRQRPV